jgi:hypothetical protein
MAIETQRPEFDNATNAVTALTSGRDLDVRIMGDGVLSGVGDVRCNRT